MAISSRRPGAPTPPVPRSHTPQRARSPTADPPARERSPTPVRSRTAPNAPPNRQSPPQNPLTAMSPVQRSRTPQRSLASSRQPSAHNLLQEQGGQMLSASGLVATAPSVAAPIGSSQTLNTTYGAPQVPTQQAHVQRPLNSAPTVQPQRSQTQRTGVEKVKTALQKHQCQLKPQGSARQVLSTPIGSGNQVLSTPSVWPSQQTGSYVLPMQPQNSGQLQPPLQTARPCGQPPQLPPQQPQQQQQIGSFVSPPQQPQQIGSFVPPPQQPQQQQQIGSFVPPPPQQPQQQQQIGSFVPPRQQPQQQQQDGSFVQQPPVQQPQQQVVSHQQSQQQQVGSFVQPPPQHTQPSQQPQVGSYVQPPPPQPTQQTQQQHVGSFVQTPFSYAAAPQQIQNCQDTHCPPASRPRSTPPAEPVVVPLPLLPGQQPAGSCVRKPLEPTSVHSAVPHQQLLTRYQPIQPRQPAPPMCLEDLAPQIWTHNAAGPWTPLYQDAVPQVPLLQELQTSGTFTPGVLSPHLPSRQNSHRTLPAADQVCTGIGSGPVLQERLPHDAPPAPRPHYEHGSQRHTYPPSPIGGFRYPAPVVHAPTPAVQPYQAPSRVCMRCLMEQTNEDLASHRRFASHKPSDWQFSASASRGLPCRDCEECMRIPNPWPQQDYTREPACYQHDSQDPYASGRLQQQLERLHRQVDERLQSHEVLQQDLDTMLDHGDFLEDGLMSARLGNSEVDHLTTTQEIYPYQKHDDEDNQREVSFAGSNSSVHIRSVSAPAGPASSATSTDDRQVQKNAVKDVPAVVNMAEHVTAPSAVVPQVEDEPNLMEAPTNLICPNLIDPPISPHVNSLTPPAMYRRDTFEPSVHGSDGIQTTPLSSRADMVPSEPHSRSPTLLPEGQRTPAPRSSYQPSEMLPTYGLDAELREQAMAKYDVSAEDNAARWVETITGVKVVGDFGASLRTGQVLCQLINQIKPGSIRKVNEAGRPFKERENITNFLKQCRAWGVHEYALFSTDDLYDEKNLASVVKCIHQLGGVVQRAVPEFDGPRLGVADTSNARRDMKRTLGPQSLTEGLRNTMSRSHIDVVSTGNVRAPTSRGGC